MSNKNKNKVEINNSNMKNSIKNKMLLYLSVINGLVLTFVINNINNDEVPIKYSIDGKVQDYGSKWTYLIFVILPIILSICQLAYDAKGKNKVESNTSKKVAEKAMPLLVILTSVIGWILAMVMIRPETQLVDASIYSWLVVAIGAWMIYVTNFYENANETGAKFSWAKNKKVLDKLKISGIIFGSIGGLIVLICGVIGVITENLIVVSSGLILGVVVAFVVPVLVAFIEYKNLSKSTNVPANSSKSNKKK